MRALTWHGKRNVRVESVPDPDLREPEDVIIRITSSGVCGSDLRLYEVMGAFMGEGDILGHEPMGIVEETGPEVREVSVGDRVVVPFHLLRQGPPDDRFLFLYAPCAYEQFQRKEDNHFKVVLNP